MTQSTITHSDRNDLFPDTALKPKIAIYRGFYPFEISGSMLIKNSVSRKRDFLNHAKSTDRDTKTNCRP